MGKKQSVDIKNSPAQQHLKQFSYYILVVRDQGCLLHALFTSNLHCKANLILLAL